jgi:6-pyruvoyltetrahydropterin/6-carboxytetrahydropterin synthase
MPYRIAKTLSFEGGHMLSKHPGDCKYPHGHSRRVEVVLEAGSLDSNDMVCDFKLLSKAFQDLVSAFDHSLCVNTLDPMFETLRKAYGDKLVAFEGKDPTSEVLAKLLFDRISVSLPLSVRLVRVRVWETAASWAEFEA